MARLTYHHHHRTVPFQVAFALLCLPWIFAHYNCTRKDDGWYYDPEHCQTYWRCIHGQAEEFKCAAGTLWDHRENRCNWMDSVDCVRVKTQANLTTFMMIPTTTTIDPMKKRKKKPIHEKRITDTNLIILLLLSLTLLPDLSSANASAELFCAGRDGFFADPDYCTRYYRCAHGVDQGFECPRGTAWDEQTKSCAWIDQVNCEEKKLDYSTSTTTEELSSTTTVTETESSKASVVPSTHGKDSSGAAAITIECQSTGIYTVADPNECHTYYQCDRGVRTKLNCPEKHLYDTEKNQCMEYERVFCGTRTVNLAEKNQCINKRDGIHPDIERDCLFYYQCVAQNKMREAKCPADQKFSSYTGKCGPASSAPAPCGTYVPGRATMSNQSIVGLAMSLLISMSLFIGFHL